LLFFRSGKWCKDKASFLNHQIFQELFATFFSQTHFCSSFRLIVLGSHRAYFLIADAKVGIIFIRANFF
ncbi:MAG: hypothetical protein IKM12_08585, partial [Alistipes sp.]|nr:hypothetical protein [Alistipes sp.]